MPHLQTMQLIDYLSKKHRQTAIEFYPKARLYEVLIVEINFSHLSDKGQIWALKKGFAPACKL